MREIKFRVYDQINKVMYTPEMDKEICNLWAIPKAQGGVLSYPNGVLMQYTGLKDNNGIEIYEGDIVTNEGAGCNLTVVFHRGRYALSYQPIKSKPNFPDIGHVEIMEIIGNIHENPELLEEK